MARTVVEHVLSRLYELGLTDVLGVPGDFAFPINDAVCSDPRLRWIGSCNELNAAYAAMATPSFRKRWVPRAGLPPESPLAVSSTRRSSRPKPAARGLMLR